MQAGDKEKFDESFAEPAISDGRCSRVLELVAEGGCHNEVHEFLQADDFFPVGLIVFDELEIMFVDFVL